MGVKQTKPWPFFGDSWRYALGLQNFFDAIGWFYNMYPNERYSGFYQWNVPNLLLRDTDLIKQIMVKDFDYFCDHRSFVDPKADPLWCRNILMLKGQEWRKMRATLSGAYTSSKMKRMFSLMNEAAETFVQHFLDKNEAEIEVEFYETFTRYTNDVIATTAYGIKTDSLKEPDNIFYIMGKNLVMPKWKFFGYMLMPTLFKVFKICLFKKQVTDFFSNAINQAIKLRKEQGGFIRNDIIDILLEARKGVNNDEAEAIDTGFATAQESPNIKKFRMLKGLSDSEIVSQALIFFVAGYHTVTRAMCFGSYELALAKEIQDKLRKEIMETNDALEGKLTYDALLKMKYMDMFVCETLRKWPPSPAMERKAVKDYTIQPKSPQEKPVHIKAGDAVIASIVGLHRDPAYFPNPMEFDPERFSDENKHKIKPYTFVPFGAGPRNCISSRFALLELKTVLFHLYLHFEIEPTKKTTIPIRMDPKKVTPVPEGGLWLKLKRIQHN